MPGMGYKLVSKKVYSVGHGWNFMVNWSSMTGFRRILLSKSSFAALFSKKRSTPIRQQNEGFRTASQISGPRWSNAAGLERGFQQSNPSVLSSFKGSSCRTRRHGFACRSYATTSAPEISSNTSPLGRSVAFGALMVGSGLATYYFYPRPQKAPVLETPEEVHTVTNWSDTHEVKTKVYIQPESLEELERVVQIAHEHKQKIRPVGSALSPNGIGLCSDGMVNLALMDSILSVDKETSRVRVQAGARVEQVVEALKPYGLTLQNYASIKEQQIGGFIQVGAHGTGATLPPVDEQVLGLKLVTPGKGTLDLSPESDPELFYFARCGLGGLGVVAEVTLQCVPRHRLLEYTFVTNMKGVRRNHKKWLNQYKHLRYLWIPDTDTVVVVQCNPLPEGKEAPKRKQLSADEKLRHVRALYTEVAAKRGLHIVPESGSTDGKPSGNEGLWSGTGAGGDKGGEETKLLTGEQLSELSFTELRDVLIAVDPLNREHITKINRAEAEYWRLSEGYRTGWSEEILGFDCGGQQWVSEVAFPVGTLKKPDMKDLKYLEEVRKLIEDEGIPAPGPIEQRWSARSQSALSLASSSSPDSLHTYVGIIMYLPTSDEKQRAAITQSFFDYRDTTRRQLWDRYNGFEHWAKTEVPTDVENLHWFQERLRKRFPVEQFNRLRTELDPNSILSNDHLDKLFPQ